MKWFRLYHDIIDDPKIAMMSESEQLLWFRILCLASMSEARGVILLSDDEIAFRLRISIESWKTAKDKFRVKGLVDPVSTEMLRISGWDNRQFESDSSTARVAAHRAKRKGGDSNVTVTLQASYSNVGCNADETYVTPTETESYPDPDSDPKAKTEDIADLKEEKKEDRIDPPPVIEAIDVEASPVAEEVASGQGKGRNKGKGGRVTKPKKRLPLELEQFQSTYNDRRPALWGEMQQVTPAREGKWKTLVEEMGGVENALTALGNALDWCSSDPWWSTKSLTFENLATNNKILQLHERQTSKLTMAGAGMNISPSNARMMNTFNRLMEAGRNAGYA